MNNLNVRKGDNVKVLTGKDKGKTGKVIATEPKSGKILVEGVNIATHHIKPRSATEQGGRKKVEAPIDSSNVQIICPSCNESVRVHHQEIDGKNARICAKCGASLDAALKADKDKKAKKAAKKSKAPAEEPAKKTKAKKAPAKEAVTDVPVESSSDGKTDKE